jgi:hypothetical protein
VSFHVSTATFLLLHCDEWDRVVALPRHKFVTGATLLQLRSCEKIILFCSLSIISCSHNLLFCSHKKDIKPKDLTPVREGKTEKSQTPKGKDFPRVSEIFASCPPTGVRFFFSLKTPNRFVYIPSSVFPAIFFFHCWSKYSIYPYASVSWQYF